MKILAFDTSSPSLTVAISDNVRILWERNQEGFLRHTENLLPLIDEGLTSSGCGLEEIELLAVGLGPGSFTGLRIGMATAKGLKCVRKDMPCLGVSSLDVIAEGASDKNGRLCAALDARRQRIYAAFYEISNGKINKKGKDFVLTSEEFIHKLRDINCLTGDVIDKFGDRIEKQVGGIEFLDKKFWYPQAANLCKIAARRFNGKNGMKISELLPMYLRKSEPEEKRVFNENGNRNT